MALVNSSGFAHVRPTVTDIARVRPTVTDIARVRPTVTGVTDSPEKIFGGTIYQTPQGTLFGLRPVDSQGFDSEHTGLKHVSFAVDSRDELEKAVAALDGAGIQHGDIVDMADAGLAILSFQDPDDINSELTALG